MNNTKLIISAIVIAIVLNIVLPLILKPFASQEEIKPPNGASELSFKGQFMHMMVHHNQVILTSSVIVALIVFLSVLGGIYLCKLI